MTNDKVQEYITYTGESRNKYKILAWKSEWKKSLDRPRLCREGTIKIDLKNSEM
jgi:hypothetical protein